MNNIDRSNNSNDIIMADDDNNVWSPLRTRESVVHRNCATFTSQRSHSNRSSQDIESEINDSSSKELSNIFCLLNNEIVLTGKHSFNENNTSDINEKQSVVELSLPDRFNYLDSSCNGASTLQSAPRYMQMTNESTVNFKTKKKPRNRLYSLKKNLNKVFLTGKYRTIEEERFGVTRQSESIRLKRTITIQDWAMRCALEDQKNRHHHSPDKDYLKNDSTIW